MLTRAGRPCHYHAKLRKGNTTPASEMARGPFEELPATERASEFPIASRDLAADGNDARPAFESTVIDGHVLVLYRDLAAVARIENDEVGVGARLDRAFLREEIEELRHLRARDIDEGVKVELPLFYAITVQQVDPLLE